MANPVDPSPGTNAVAWMERAISMDVDTLASAVAGESSGSAPIPNLGGPAPVLGAYEEPPSAGGSAQALEEISALQQMEAGGTGLGDEKLLIHALLCTKERGQCEQPKCQLMRGLLAKVEAHTQHCTFDTSRGRCPKCVKWHKMVQLREHMRRELLNQLCHTQPAVVEGVAIAQTLGDR